MKDNTAVVIVNYFSSNFITKAVDVFHDTPFDIFIIDNSCDRNEQNRLKEIKNNEKRITLVFNSYNVGFGPAISHFVQNNNNYKSYTFVNPDIIGINTKKFRGQLELFLESEYCLFQPLIIDNLRKENSIQGIIDTRDIYVFLEYTLFKFFFKRSVITAQKVKNGLTDLFIPSGAFFTIKKSALLLIGGFPSTTFLYFEEWLIASKIKKKHSHIGYIDSNIIVKHDVGGSTKLKFGISNRKMSLIRLNSFIKAVDEIFKRTLLIKILIYFDFILRSILSLILKTYVKLKG